MPSGKKHDRITWICFPLIVIITLLLVKKLDIAIITATAFVFSGLMFGPDLDIYSVQYKRWGWFKFIWLPYQKNLKHRSFLSHGFLIGTIIRLLYLSIILFVTAILIVAIAQLIWGFDWNWQQLVITSYQKIINDYLTQTFALLIGLELGAMSHYLADEIGSRLKAFQKKKATKSKVVKQKKVRTKIKAKPRRRSKTGK